MRKDDTQAIQQNMPPGGWRAAVRAIVFLALAAALFAYLNMALVTKGSSQNRGNFDALYDTQPEVVDVLYVGTSATSRLFVNPVAFNDYGIASYSFGVQNSPFFYVDDLIEEARATQSPRLVIIELRQAMKKLDSLTEEQLRLTLDTIHLFTPRRPSMTLEAVTNKITPRDGFVDLLIPICKYHSRLVQGDVAPEEFLLQGVTRNATQGFQMTPVTLTQVPQTGPYLTDKVGEIPARRQKQINQLLDYCDTLDMDVLFVMSPFNATKKNMLKLNAIEQTIKDRGYTVLNCNKEQTLKEIGLDWSTDFYNRNHTNYQGALKYTDFFCRYLKEHYDLPDRRGDSRYSAWETGYAAFQDFVAGGILYYGEEDSADEE